MSTIRITKEFRFEAAHALKGYDGPCRNVHGHSYELAVTVSGSPISDRKSAKYGMVMDFGDLKCLIKANIIDVFDHALILHSNLREEHRIPSGEPFTNVVFVDYQPTSENILIDMVGRIKKLLPENIRLHHLALRETSTSYAEWYASDQVISLPISGADEYQP
ncbi:MAG: 6-carboxytetrahydropterin synthase [Bacteroidetes bacterium]|nr:6-carboxytetrahydropterin synthase [Bacteroidota bacterium]